MQRSNSSKLKITWEDFVILILLIQVFVIQWLSYSKYYCLIIDGVLLFYLIVHPRFLSRMKRCFIPILALLLYCVYQSVRPGSQIKVLISNVYPIMTSVLIVFAMCFLGSGGNRVKATMVKLFPLINGYMIINIPVLMLQVHDHFELSGRHPEGITKVFKPDMISGLFGFYGTPMLAVFSAFFFVYDLWYLRHCVRRRNRAFFIVYYLFMFAFYLYISTKNENNGYYLVLASFMAIYYLYVQNNYRKIIQVIKRAFKGIVLTVLACVLAVIGYKSIPAVNSIANKYINNFNLGSTTYYGGGSSVRFAMVYYYLSRADVNKPFGAGMGTIEWRENYSFGFKNFGQSDLGSFLLIGGFVFVALIILVFGCCVHAHNKSFFLTACECVLLLMLLVYTQPFTTASTIVSCMLFILVCGLERDAANRMGPISAMIVQTGVGHA